MDLLRTRYRPAMIPGMVDVVSALAPHRTLAVLSTNGIEAIRRILVDAGIATCFSHVFSAELQPRKSESMRRFLGDYRYAAQRCCSPAYREEPTGDDELESSDCVLVTDTVGDVAEAKEVGIATVGVAWGTHSERQLLDAGAKEVALWPQEFVAWLRPEDCRGPACGSMADATASGAASTDLQAAGRLRRDHWLHHRRAAAAAAAGQRRGCRTVGCIAPCRAQSVMRRARGVERCRAPPGPLAVARQQANGVADRGCRPSPNSESRVPSKENSR
ncbi:MULTISPECIES: HAD hydrolase-like protein [unclassified Methylibium]|uniref:HAD family hydrolase n=1 Tax=unclassified Methylibium TaxID=2633235 RepID=UPI0003F4624D|nr:MULTISPECIES: HAD hydrolase-like protein [unclassified Methylibium]EWS54790.1 hypothetical protein X551_02390 [Methylibium sp. T29]EWS59096.1 hypothetical protein Y694_03073 [Methylibium sp. T29-B]